MAHLAQAAEAGKVIFVAGKATVADQPAVDGAPVGEGQMLSTGADGFLYVKTVDSGLFILRPNTKARIVTYHVDEKNPANTQVKLELLSGVARSKSGNAVKQARQNFRFNTPVAAIGVRGTDFTVFTDNDTSRVAVISGAIVMSGFAGSCRPDGAGPCEGSASRELSAAQRGQLLQLQRGQATPQLLQSSPLSPDQVSPPRPDEPLAHAGSAGGGANSATGQTNLDVQKAISLNEAVNNNKAPPFPPPSEVPPPTPPTPVPPAIALPDRGIVWGRWTVVAGRPPTFNLANTADQNELLELNGNYALLRTRGPDTYIAPSNGSIGFQLRNSEAFVYTDYTPTYRVETPATLSNGVLTVDFGKQSFATSVDMTSQAGNATLQATGAVGADGQLHGDSANGRANIMNVRGLLSNQNGGSAAYIFDSRLDDKRTVNGVTYWEKSTR
ncbi:FecR family protein [Massilia kyonggiensis]|nr:FecR family protein [Massilia kyonggiensis]